MAKLRALTMPDPKPTTMMASAPATRSRFTRSPKGGICSEKAMSGRAPTTATPPARRSSAADSARPRTMAITAAGIPGATCRMTRRKANVPSPTATVKTCTSPIWARKSTIGLRRPSVSIEIPVRRFTCPMMRLMDMPARKPASMGLDRKLARNPRRKAPATKHRSPTTMLKATVAWTPLDLAAVAKRGEDPRQDDAGRRVGADHQLAGRSEQGISDQGEYRREQADFGGQPGDRGVGDGGWQRDGRDRQAGGEVGLQPAGAIIADLSHERQLGRCEGEIHASSCPGLGRSELGCLRAQLGHGATAAAAQGVGYCNVPPTQRAPRHNAGNAPFRGVRGLRHSSGRLR